MVLNELEYEEAQKLRDSVRSEIGELAICFQYLEEALIICLAEICDNLGTSKKKVKVADRTFYEKINLYRTLATEHIDSTSSVSDDWKVPLEKILGRADFIREERNDIIHSSWKFAYGAERQRACKISQTLKDRLDGKGRSLSLVGPDEIRHIWNLSTNVSYVLFYFHYIIMAKIADDMKINTADEFLDKFQDTLRIDQ